VEFVDTAYQFLISALQEIAAVFGGVINRLPAEWPIWIRVVVVFVGFIILAQAIISGSGKLRWVWALPWRLDTSKNLAPPAQI